MAREINGPVTHVTHVTRQTKLFVNMNSEAYTNIWPNFVRNKKCKYGVIMSSVASVCVSVYMSVCLCVCIALTFAILAYKVHFGMQTHYIRVI